MGFDLRPLNPAPNALIDEFGIEWGRYNYAGWKKLISILDQYDVPTNEFTWLNDKETICNETCLKVADVLEKHMSQLSAQERQWLEPHVALWRTCGGYEVW